MIQAMAPPCTKCGTITMITREAPTAWVCPTCGLKHPAPIAAENSPRAEAIAPVIRKYARACGECGAEESANDLREALDAARVRIAKLEARVEALGADTNTDPRIELDALRIAVRGRDRAERAEAKAERKKYEALGRASRAETDLSAARAELEATKRQSIEMMESLFARLADEHRDFQEAIALAQSMEAKLRMLRAIAARPGLQATISEALAEVDGNYPAAPNSSGGGA